MQTAWYALKALMCTCSTHFILSMYHIWTWNSWLSHNAFHLSLAAAGCARACVFSCDFKNVSRICNNQECALCVCVVMRKGPSLQRQGWEATSVTLSHSEWRILHHKCWWRQDFVSLSPNDSCNDYCEDSCSKFPRPHKVCDLYPANYLRS